MYEEDIYIELKRFDQLMELLRLKELEFPVYDRYFGTCDCGN